MRIGEVHDMDEVTQTGSVTGVPVGPEYLYLGAPTQGGIDQKRKNVLLRRVILAQASVRIGSRGIKIPQADALEAKRGVVVPQNPLEHQLRFAVRVRGFLRMIFGNRNHLWLAVGRRRGGEDKGLDSGIQHGSQENKA